MHIRQWVHAGAALATIKMRFGWHVPERSEGRGFADLHALRFAQGRATQCFAQGRATRR